VTGITACQMDIKVDGFSSDILREALTGKTQGRLHILGEIAKTISEPRPDYKPFVPRIFQMKVPKEFIGAIIGPGGKVIQEMQRETGTTIVIQEVGEFGIVDIIADNVEAKDAVVAKIKGIIAQFLKLARFTKERLRILCLLAHSSKSFPDRTDCFIFLKSTGPALKKWKMH
jgi:polyribonucleotide nucleotidyltransferase